MYHIIVNPVAKSGLVKKIRLRVHHTLSLRYLPFRSYTTSYHGHARELAAQIISAPWDSQEDSLIAICGDGTVNEDLNGIRHLERVPCRVPSHGRGNRRMRRYLVRATSLKLHTFRPMTVDLDGESGGLQTDLEIALEQEFLKVITPGQEV